MKILFLCWRDIKNPRSGGAEVYIHEVARRLVDEGHEVTLFTARWSGAPAGESIDGVGILRRGAQATVHCHFMWWWLRGRRRQGFDLVIDVVNTLPFLTPLLVRERDARKLALFFQLCREIWFYESVVPLSAIGYLGELLYLKLYRRMKVVTISESSRRDLIAKGIPEKAVSICPVGISVRPLESVEPKGDGLDMLFVGRLTASKRPDHVIKAFSRVLKERPEARLWIAGDGRPWYRARLERLARELLVDGAVDFKGRVSEEEKERLMLQAHVIAVTSVKEGWGLIVTEANALGTPAVVYDVDGLRDSVRDGETGIVCRTNTPEALAEEVLSLSGDAERYQRLRQTALEWSRQFTWDRTAAEFRKVAGIQ